MAPEHPKARRSFTQQTIVCPYWAKRRLLSGLKKIETETVGFALSTCGNKFQINWVTKWMVRMIGTWCCIWFFSEASCYKCRLVGIVNMSTINIMGFTEFQCLLCYQLYPVFFLTSKSGNQCNYTSKSSVCMRVLAYTALFTFQIFMYTILKLVRFTLNVFK